MESLFARIIIYMLVAGALLYLGWQVLLVIDRCNAQRAWEARRRRGEISLCLHDPKTGSIIRTRAPRED